LPRKVRDSKLETRTARSRLKVAHKPYFRLIEPGLHLGYRKLASGPGTWVARRYDSDQRTYAVMNLKTPDGRLIVADDYSDANSKTVLSFAQAQEQVKAHRPRAQDEDDDDEGPYTVAKAMDAYFAFLETEGRSSDTIRDARWRDDAFIRPKLGNVEVAVLTAKRLRKWRDGLVQMAPRLRTKKDESQKHRADNGDDTRRARRSSANRTWTILRAALNHAFENSKADSDIEWRKVKPFKKVDAARPGHLTIAEAKRLINASDPDFRLLVQAALQTGARYSELARLTVSDFISDVGKVRIQQSKSGEPRHIVLTDEGRALFEQLTAGRSGSELILHKANGSAWGKSHQARPMAEACKRAGIKPPISFHGLRHSWTSLAVMADMPLLVVAKNLGHSSTRMVEKHYGHLTESYIADEIRAGAPRFGFKPSNVKPMRKA
jgi:integrase